MNKTEQTGVIREIGRYEINIEEKGTISTLLKKDISHLTATPPLITPVAPSAPSEQVAELEGPSSRPNVQQEFLDKAIREKLTLTIFLMTGQRVRASIEAYDNFTLLVREGGSQHLFYKHAITTINR